MCVCACVCVYSRFLLNVPLRLLLGFGAESRFAVSLYILKRIYRHFGVRMKVGGSEVKLFDYSLLFLFLLKFM